MGGNLRVFNLVYKILIGPRRLSARWRHLIYRDFVPDPTQGCGAPLRIPTLVAARPRSILTLDVLKFPPSRGIWEERT